MFHGDLTRSVISVIYAQNEGDVVGAVDTLLNICHDEEVSPRSPFPHLNFFYTVPLRCLNSDASSLELGKPHD